MDRLAHRRVVHVQIVADGPHDDLAGTDPDPHGHRDAMRPPELLGVAAGGVQQRQRGVAGTDSVILVGDWRAEHRHQAVAHQPRDGPLVAVDGIHHQLHHAVQQLLRLFGVAVADQLGGANDVREEDGDLLALTDQALAGGQDALGEVGRGVARGRRRLSNRCRSG